MEIEENKLMDTSLRKRFLAKSNFSNRPFYLCVILLPFLYVLEWWMISDVGFNPSGEHRLGVYFIFFLPRISLTFLAMSFLTISYVDKFTKRPKHYGIFAFISFLLIVFQTPVINTFCESYIFDGGSLENPHFFNFHLFFLLFVHSYSLKIILISDDKEVKKIGTVLISISLFLSFLIYRALS